MAASALKTPLSETDSLEILNQFLFQQLRKCQNFSQSIFLIGRTYIRRNFYLNTLQVTFSYFFYCLNRFFLLPRVSHLDHILVIKIASAFFCPQNYC